MRHLCFKFRIKWVLPVLAKSHTKGPDELNSISIRYTLYFYNINNFRINEGIYVVTGWTIPAQLTMKVE